MGMKYKKKHQRAQDPLAGTATEEQVHEEIDGAATDDASSPAPDAAPVTATTADASQETPEVIVKSPIQPGGLPGGPDATHLKAADWPLLEPPAVLGSRDLRYQVIFRQSVLDNIHDHGKGYPEVEVCGVLVGNIYQDGIAPYAYVEACIRGNDALTKQTQVTITSETWSRIHETLEKEHPDKRIIGWYHTHPGFGIFLSGMDLFIQDSFFNAPWQVAFVYDPLGGDEGVFVWRAGKPSREQHLVENDTGAALVPAGFAAANVVAGLAERVATLENKVNWLWTAVAAVLVVALLWPLFFVTYFPEKVRNLLDIGDEPPAQAQVQKPPVNSVARSNAAPAMHPALASDASGRAAAGPQTQPSAQTAKSNRTASESVALDSAVAASSRIITPTPTSADKTGTNGRTGGPKILDVSPDEWAPARRQPSKTP